MFLIWSQAKMNQNFLQKIYHANVNVDLIEENVIQINDWITINVDMSVKSVMYLKKVIFGWLSDYVWWSSRRNKNSSKQFWWKKAVCKTQKFDILLAFLFVTIVLLIAVCIYCYLIKYWAKKKHLLRFHKINNELELVL